MNTNIDKAAGRRAETTQKLLHVALKLGEEIGFEALTMEKIARECGVAKTTLYRRWPNVWAMVMDAFLQEIMRAAPIVERETAKESLAASMRLLARAYRGRLGDVLRLVVGQAQFDPVLRAAVKTRWVEPRRQLAREVIARGKKSGELPNNLNDDVLLDALYGPFYHRMLVPHKKADLSDRFVNDLVELVFAGAGARKRPK